MQIPSSILHDLAALPDFSPAAFLQAQSEDAAVSVRLHPRKPLALFPASGVVPWCAEGRYLPSRPSFTLDPAYHAGAYYVQEASSMFLAHAVRQVLPAGSTGLRVLDLCAAPGGKSTLLASVLGEENLLVSNEVIRARASILEENLTRWGHANTIVSSNDPRDFSRLPGYFDAIVVDAPCSGSGLFRKDKAALDQWSDNNVTLCGQRQERILADVLPALRQDGYLIYSTCSYSLREDEQILDWLSTQQSMESVRLTNHPDWRIRETQSACKAWGYKFLPGEVRGEGFFLAVLRKTQPAATVAASRFRSTAEKGMWQQIPWFTPPEGTIMLQTQPGVYSFLRAEFEPDLQLLQKNLYLRKAGTRLGEPAHKDWIPAHDAALSIFARSENIPSITVTADEALRFLKKEDFIQAHPPRGWYQVRYQGLGLGWVKSLGNRINNYLPKHWRIRMELPDELVRE
jgi:16S rRNA C967 or C1407 C5-methylase (RsmB/RsmF family)/NOL1/NOP2/fmu family ribosome biogenesis protein